jgi:hypothetical protein
MLIQELPCLDSNIAGQLLLIEFCNTITPGADSVRDNRIVRVGPGPDSVLGSQTRREPSNDFGFGKWYLIDKKKGLGGSEAFRYRACGTRGISHMRPRIQRCSG